MPAPLVIAGIVFAVGAAAVLYFWSRIVHFLSTRLIPWIREKISVGAGDVLATLVAWADRAIVPTRALLRAGWDFLVHRILGIKRTYTRVESGQVNASTETYVANDANQVSRVVSEEVVSWTDLPADIRDALMQTPTASATLDMKKVLFDKIQERAEEDGVILEVQS